MPDADGSRIWVTGPFIRFTVSHEGVVAITWRSLGFFGRRQQRGLRPHEITVQRAHGRGRTRGLRIDGPARDVFYIWGSARVREQILSELGAAGADVVDGEFQHDWLRIGLDDYRPRRT
jgi:hypothetical protein